MQMVCITATRNKIIRKLKIHRYTPNQWNKF